MLKFLHEPLDAIVIGKADCLVEAPVPLRGADDVPQPDAMIRKTIEPVLIGKLGQGFSDDLSKQSPELVLRMGVILPGSERRVAWQAAEDEQPRIGPRNWSETDFHSA
ncbi:hypothetical protein GCM10023264_12770 [Sphingomonas daechungensis]